MVDLSDVDEIIEVVRNALMLAPQAEATFAIVTQISPRTTGGFMGFVVNPVGAGIPSDADAQTTLAAAQTAYNQIMAAGTEIRGSVLAALTTLNGWLASGRQQLANDEINAVHTLQNWLSGL